MNQTKEVNILRIGSDERHKEKDLIISEIPFTILLNGKEVVTLLCSPEKLEYLAVGFLLAEGLIKRKSQIKSISLGKDGYYANADLTENIQIPPDFFQKRLISSGCGKGAHFYDPQDAIDCKISDSKIKISQGEIFQLMKEMQKRSSLFKTTGGVHSASLCNTDEIEIFAEDIGRHNAIDKIFGECFLKDISAENKIILTSGRISSEILIKVAKQKVPVIISRAAPTDLGVALAEDLKITLIGFARGKRMNCYTHNFRIV